MTPYLIRRLVFALPILIGVNLITFALFFMVNSPDDMARMQLGVKRVDQAAIERWKEEKGYNRPLFINSKAEGLGKFKDTIFYEKSLRLFVFDFGRAEDGRDISREIADRMGPSLAIAIPSFIIGLLVDISLALIVVLFYGTRLDHWVTILCIALMSISSLFYIIVGQYLFSKTLSWVPISGYGVGEDAIKFLILPVIIGVVGGIGAGVRWYRMIFLQESQEDYLRTARAKGLSELRVLFQHLLPNAMIPILTGVVVVIPTLFLGSLLTESFFGIPGLGSYTIDAIASQEFAVVRAMVFLGSLLYLIGPITNRFCVCLG